MDKNSTKYQVESSPAIKSNTSSYSENYILSGNGIFNIYGNCSESEIKKAISEASDWGINLIQFARSFSVDDSFLRSLNEMVLTPFPDCSLRLNLNRYGTFTDLELLSKIPNIRDLRIETNRELDLTPINKYCSLRRLSIGEERVKIREIAKHKSIRDLFVFGNIKDVQVIGEMENLSKLTISKKTLKSLDFLEKLKELEELHFFLGSTNNLQFLPQIGKIQKLSFTLVRMLKIENLLPINDMQHINEIKFDSQPHLTDLDWLKKSNVKVEVINCSNFKK